MFIERQSHRSSVNNPEPSWHYLEESSDTNDYCGQQQRFHYQPAHYTELQQYCHDRTTEKISSYHAYER